ncbi:MAG TPA: ribosome biogenesis GTPase Der [Acidobacteriota bacterium]|nr:ribosome biogenesis GTPase Der [Acidobacteriota bacterium]
MPPLVTIVGRPNVGKSTLFNRLARRRRAIVDDAPGITRDRIYDEIELDGRLVRLVDTGGLDLDDSDSLISGIRDQALRTVTEADVIILLVDVRAGLTPVDRELAAHLRRHSKPLLLALNKVDGPKQEPYAAEFYSLGIEDSVQISAEHGAGIAALAQRVREMLPPPGEEAGEEAAAMKVAIIGRPNVGKSSLLNAIIGEGRMLVSEIAGTTRDVVDVSVEIGGRRFVFLDTAGIRRKALIRARVEVVGSIKARRTIAEADCCILMLDANEGLTAQDKALGGMIDKNGSGALIVMNKWDLVPSDEDEGRKGDRSIRDIAESFFSLRYAPIVTTCALTGLHVDRLIEYLLRIAETQERTISPAELARFLEAAQARYSIPAQRGKEVQILRMNQVTSSPARFRIFVRGTLPDNYLRYLENALRDAFDFEGVPIRFAIVHR